MIIIEVAHIGQVILANNTTPLFIKAHKLTHIFRMQKYIFEHIPLRII